MSLCYISFVLIFALIYQEANTEKILYGLDDIKRARDIIIVEGEIDKLSMEEAGYRNCVSVPDGAPPKVSSKLPDKDQLG
jgi:twinkle protein